MARTGGTWMGLNAASGTFAALTNVRSKTKVPGKTMPRLFPSPSCTPHFPFPPAPMRTPDQYLTTPRTLRPFLDACPHAVLFFSHRPLQRQTRCQLPRGRACKPKRLRVFCVPPPAMRQHFFTAPNAEVRAQRAPQLQRLRASGAPGARVWARMDPYDGDPCSHWHVGLQQ